MKLTLYIDGKAADLSAGGDDALILWTYTRDDAEAPAAVKNSYTKTITLPATDANAAIFGHAGVLDRVTASGMFDALQRTPFIVYGADGRILERGYLKLDSIARRGEVVLSYDVTLYGGLGGFFYALTYKADGTKMTLADIRWANTSDNPTTANLVNLLDPATAPEVPTIQQGWADLCDGYYFYRVSGIVNYVPANNGIPDGNFDASRAYYKPETGQYAYENLEGVSTQVTDSGTTYTPHPDANGGVILELGGKFTEWEMQTFPDILQREAWNFARFLQSIELGSQAGDFGAWRLIIDHADDFFDEQSGNPYFWKTWVTLEPDESRNVNVYSHLRGTKTPADYLLGFAKMFGLVFIVDEAEQTITLTTRNTYYAGGYAAGVIDLSDRVDTHGQPASVTPYLMTARLYAFSVPTPGAFADGYKARYGRVYGDFLLDSGFTFDAGRVDVMGSVPFSGIADVKESSPWYFTKAGSATSAPLNDYIKFSEYNEVTYLLYASYGSKSFKVSVPQYSGMRFKYSVPTLPQFHDADGKRLKAPDVLLFLDGKITLPAGDSTKRVRWHIGNWRDLTGNLAGGKMIWNLSPRYQVHQVTEIPCFRRWHDYMQDYATLDFGDPLEIASDYVEQARLYNVFSQFWRNYMADRFDRDSMVLTARVNLAGLPVGHALLRRFFYYRGSLWSLNKITDYNPARPGLTRCEFVRVKDVTNYTSGQSVPI